MANIASIAIQIQANTASFDRGLGAAQAGLRGLASASGASMGTVGQAVDQGLNSAQGSVRSFAGLIQDAGQLAGGNPAQAFVGQVDSSMGQLAGQVQHTTGTFDRLLRPIQAVKSAVDRWTDLPGVRQLKAGIGAVNKSFDDFLQRRYGALAKPIKFAGMALDVGAMSQGMVIPGISILGSLGAAATVEGVTVGARVGRSITQGIVSAAREIPGAVSGIFSSASAATGTFGHAIQSAAARIPLLGSALKAMGSSAGGASSALQGLSTGLAAAVTMKVLDTAIGVVTGAFSGLGQRMQEIQALGNQAGTLGVTVNGLRALRAVAAEVQTPVETLSQGLDMLQRHIGEGLNPANEMARNFRALGLDARALTNIPLDRAFGQIADRINALPDPASRAAAAVSIFGRSGQGLLDVLERGSAGINATAQAMSNMLSSADIANVTRANIAFLRLKGSVSSFGTIIAARLAPSLAGIATNLAPMVRAFQPVFSIIGSIVGAVLSLADVVLSVGRILMSVFAPITMMLKPIALVFKLIGSAIGGIGDGVRAAARAIEGFVNGAIGLLVRGLAKLFEFLAKLPRFLGGGHFQRWARNLTATADQLQGVQPPGAGPAPASVPIVIDTSGVPQMLASAQAIRDQLINAVRPPAGVDVMGSFSEQLDRMRQEIATIGLTSDQQQVIQFHIQGVSEADLERMREMQRIRQARQLSTDVLGAEDRNANEMRIMGLSARQAEMITLARRGANPAMLETLRIQNQLMTGEQALRTMRQQGEAAGMTPRQAAILQAQRDGASAAGLAALREEDRLQTGNELIRSLREQSDTVGMTANQAAIFRAQLNGASVDAINTARAMNSAMVGQAAIRSMREQLDTMGMTARQAAILRATQEGATPNAIAQLRFLDQQLSAMEEMNRLQESANRMREAALTPLETFQNGMAEVQRLMENVANFSADDAARQIDRLMTQLDGTMQRAEARAPSGLQRGSGEALSAINQAQLESGRGSENATERLQRILEEARNIQARQEQRLSEIRDALVSGDIFGLASWH